MRWLVHGNLTRAVTEALRRHEHTASTPAEAGIDATDPVELLKQAHTKQLDLITADAELANAPFEHHIRFGRSIVFLQLTGGDVEQDDAIDRLFQRYKRLTPGRLYTVTATRVKIRQLPST
ncbi:MAG TPA: DUF5615 family PIN-like protein [Tepidisphaeraceae bacterium]|jgi:predicted nuclease of predicted toxin-antitoxin system